MRRPTRHRPLAALALLPVLSVTAGGCDRKADATPLAPSASALASSQAAPAARAWHFTIDPKSTTQVDMPGVTEHLKGDTSAAAGTLDVVPADLAQSRGTIKIDLSTFTTHTFGNDQDATQTEHARTWLEVVVNGKTNEGMRWATLAIRSIDGLSATDLTKVAAVGDVRTVTMTVHGDVLIHGHQLTKDVPVEVTFSYPQGAAPDAVPTKVTVKSKQPMHIVLKEVDVQPRDTVGALTAWTTRLISKVAETADVTVALTGNPSS
jgi:hypothetical protein